MPYLITPLLLPLFFRLFAPLDRLYRLQCKKWRNREVNPSFLQLQSISYLVGGLRSGIDLQQLLEKPNLPTQARKQVQKLYQQITQKVSNSSTNADPLVSLLYSSLREGNSCLGPLLRQRQLLRRRMQMEKKMQSASAQARLQAKVLLFLPPLVFGIFIITAPDLAGASLHNRLSNFCLILAAVLLWLCQKWLKKILGRTLLLQNPADKIQFEFLPRYIEQVLGFLQSGLDLHSAQERALANLAINEEIRKILTGQQTSARHEYTAELATLHQLITRAENFGAPIRQELLDLLEDLQYSLEQFLEERIQKLPIFLLAPLFSCAFPSALLVLLSILFPALGAE